MDSDIILQKYIRNNLNYWKEKRWDEKKLIEIIKKYNLHIAKIEIKKGNVKILDRYNTKINVKLKKTIDFLKDVSKEYLNLDTIIFINTSDTLNYENTNIYNINGNKTTKKINKFVWGVAEDSNYINIVDSEPIEEYNSSYPVFCFERDRRMHGILFPTFGADNKDFKNSINIDKFNFDDKEIEIPIFRGKNICCDINYLDKIDLINYSYLNNQDTNFKFCSKDKHPIWDKFMVSKPHLKFFQNINKIDPSINIDDFRNYFSSDNFEDLDYLSNSCILEYKFKNKEYFHEDIFEDMEDIIYFNLDNLKNKLEQLKKNNYELSKKLIKNRKIKFNKYLDYYNLVNWYGKFLLEYQKLKV